MTNKRRTSSVADELLEKSREAALSAVQTFNNPLVMFKSETYIVLMIIGWTYLLHSYYRKQGVEYRYYRQGNKRRIFERTKSGAYKYWELERCLNDDICPLDKDTTNNLRFLIQIRHEIEHQMTWRLDEFLGGRYQACAMNYSRYVKQLFGERYGIDQYLTYSLQFIELSYGQLPHDDILTMIPSKLQKFITEFDQTLTEEEFNHEAFSYRLYFSKKLVNRPGQADRVVEFIDPTSDLAQTIDKEYWVKKEVEKPKFLPKDIVQQMRAKGFRKFNVHHHTKLWKEIEAKKPGKGYGAYVANTWYWYESWMQIVEQHCKANADSYAA